MVCGREMNGGTHQHLVVVVEVVAGHAGVRVLVNDGLGLQSVRTQGVDVTVMSNQI